MDFATIIGIIIAWGAVYASLMLEGGNVKDLFNLPAFIIVIFGTIGATIIGTSMQTIMQVPSVLGNIFTSNKMDQLDAIDEIVDLAKKARREGILALDNITPDIEDRLIRKGIEMVVDGTPGTMVREVLETEIVTIQERHRAGQNFFTSLGGFSPTLGIIGTVMGLIAMLAKVNEPNKMGHAIAQAFVATLLGVGLANLLYLPIASKLRNKTAEEIVNYEMIIEGILSIQNGDNPRVVETKMMAYLPPKMREEMKYRRTHWDDEDRMAA
ncbi:MAG: flagellar motor protein [Armatimonadota bacterium]